MLPVWTALGIWAASVAALARRLALQRRARRAALWTTAAEEAGLQEVERSDSDLEGRAGAFRVRLCHGKSDMSGTLVTVSGPGLPAELTMWPEEVADLSPRTREIELGDAEFDDAARLEGSPVVAHAVLDVGTRRLLRTLFQGTDEHPGRSLWRPSGRLQAGTLRIEIPDSSLGRRYGVLPDPFIGREGRLSDALVAAIELARRLTAPSDVARRIADNLKGEPVARVRRASLGVLVRDYPDHPATREALVAAREDPDAEVRLRAGIALGPEGRDVLRALAAGEGAEDDTTARAVAALDPDVTVDEAASLLRNALRTRRVETAKACTVALGRRGGPEAIALLGRVLAVETADLGQAAARALAMTGDAAAEPPLLRALAEGEPDVRLAAAAALGHAGTAAAVEALREAQGEGGPMRRTARQAIAEIQSRLTGAEAGQLTLTGGESGQLSLAAGEEGALTLAEREPLRARASEKAT